MEAGIQSRGDNTRYLVNTEYGYLAVLTRTLKLNIDTSGAIIISSANRAFVFGNTDNACFLSEICTDISGMEINIYGSKLIPEQYLENTKFNKIKASFEKENTAYNQEKYLFDGDTGKYMIDIYVKNFDGDSAAIIDGFLSSLHE